ncbi:MAG TPA: hypothetical protein VGE74_02365 [Gemmata sp.]
MGLKEIRERERARKAAGADQTYPHHAGKAARVGKAAPASLPLLTSAPCVHEGRILAPCHSCGSDQRHVRDCELHGTCTRVAAGKDVDRVCARCPQYTAPERAGDPRTGVVIGSYKWPELVELQIRLVRATCGPVPILVSNDRPEEHPALSALGAAHPDVTLVTSPERLGHTGGDVAAFRRGVEWGAARGLAVVAKLSQRMLFTAPYWLQDGARELLASGLPAASRKAVEPPGYALRTEAVLLDVAQWNAPAVLARIGRGRYWHERPGGYCGEAVIHDVIRDELGGVFLPWALLPNKRSERGAFVWHNSHTRADYDALAARYGVTLPADFTVSGWEWELKKGEYVFG